MFCYQCGKEFPEGAAFCPNCGASASGPAAATAVATAAAPSAASTMFKSFLNILKGVFSKDAVKTVGAQAKNTGFEWIIGIVLAVLSFALATPVNIVEGFTQLIKEAVGEMGSYILDYIELPFFSFFGVSLLIGAMVLGTVVAGLWLLAKLVTKKNVSWVCVLNLVATATLPLSACYITNMLLGLIWVPLAILVSNVALIMTLVLLYAGFQKLEKPEVSPFYPYSAFVAVVMIVACVLSFLLYKGVITSWFGELAGGSLDILGDLLG